VTISTGLLMLIIVLLAWKMRGAQLPHVFLGMILVESAAGGSMVRTISAEGLGIVNSTLNAIANALGNGNIV
jgi:hypothetical protein